MDKHTSNTNGEVFVRFFTYIEADTKVNTKTINMGSRESEKLGT